MKRFLGWLLPIMLLGIRGGIASSEEPPSSMWLERFQKEWAIEVLGNPIVETDPSGVVRATLQNGESARWHLSPATDGLEHTVILRAKVSQNSNVNCIPLAVFVDGVHYLHLHANTYASHENKFYGDRNYNDGLGDVATVSPLKADDQWHTYRIAVSSDRIESWIDGEVVHSEPWPFGDSPWSWEIHALGDHETTFTFELKAVQLS